MRGRKPKAPALRVLEGNPGHRRVPVPPEVRAGLPRRPSTLSVVARREWEYLLADMKRLGIRRIDRGALVAYVEAIAEHDAASQVLQEKGRVYRSVGGDLRPRPECGMLHRSALRIARLAAELGLSPVARTRLGSIGFDSSQDGLGILS